jgi:ornithine carbamoyltransferase
MRHLLTLLDLGTAELKAILSESARLKADFLAGQRPPLLAGRILGMVFEKPSLRTRASFEAAIHQLGGSSIFLSATDGPMGQRESVPDFARSLSQYADAIVLRTYKQATVEEFARWSSAPVINGLSDQYHPCQVLGDLLTIQETFGTLAGRTVVFVGDGNNVSRTLALGCGGLGIRFIMSAPEGYGFDAAFLKLYRETHPQGELIEEHSPTRALAQADIVYTDVWTSMGQEAEREERRRRFSDYQVNATLLAQAPAHARVMHCLPAVRGEEITAEVIDGPRSIVFEQASNRLHAQKGLLKWLLLDQHNGRAG